MYNIYVSKTKNFKKIIQPYKSILLNNEKTDILFFASGAIKS